MQKYDWPRLFTEVRPTFLPYARFKMRTTLSPEQCREKLASVTQPQDIPALFSAPTSSDVRVMFKGRVSASGILAVPLDQNGIKQQYRSAKPFYLAGKLEPTREGTDLVVRVLPDPLGILLLSGVLLALAYQMGITWSLSSAEKLVFEPFLLARFLLAYAALTLPASFEAYQARKILERLLHNG